MHPVLLEILPWVRQGYCCSQLLLLLALRQRGEENGALLRAVHGLCHGLGQSGGPCGLLTGGVAVLGLLAGRGHASEEPHQYFTALINEYAEWFYARVAAYGDLSCPRVAEGLAGEAGQSVTAGSMPDPVLCGTLLGDCWDKIVELAASYELDWDA